MEILRTCEGLRRLSSSRGISRGPISSDAAAPVTGWLAIAMPIVERVQRLPAWAQPMAAGALLFVGYGLFKLIFLLPAIMRSPVKGALTALMGIALSGSIGAAPGFLYGQHRRLRERRSGLSCR